MESRILCRNGKCVDLDVVECETVFNDSSDIIYCENKKSEWLSSSNEYAEFY